MSVDKIGERTAAFLEEAKAIRWFKTAADQMKNMIWFFLFMRRATGGGENDIRKSGNLKFIHWKIWP